MNAYDLTLKFIKLCGDLDAAMAEKSCNNNTHMNEVLDRRIDGIESQIWDVKKQLKKTNVNL